MKKSRFAEAQMIGMLREQEAGAKTEEVCRRYGISDAGCLGAEGFDALRRTLGKN